MNNQPAWPNPFRRWSEEAKATSCVPADYRPSSRDEGRDLLLARLLEAAQSWELTPNDRCGILTCCAALMICPQSVQYALTDRILRLASPAEEAVPALDGRGNVGPPGLEADSYFVQVSFETLHGSLRIDRSQQVVEWLAVNHAPDLAITYSDHENDMQAVRWLREFLPNLRDDHSVLQVVAACLDSVHRQLDPAYPHWEDLRAWLATSD